LEGPEEKTFLLNSLSPSRPSTDVQESLPSGDVLKWRWGKTVLRRIAGRKRETVSNRVSKARLNKPVARNSQSLKKALKLALTPNGKNCVCNFPVDLPKRGDVGKKGQFLGKDPQREKAAGPRDRIQNETLTRAREKDLGVRREKKSTRAFQTGSHQRKTHQGERPAFSITEKPTCLR